MSPRPPQPDNFETDADHSASGGNGILSGPLLVWAIFGGAAVIATVMIAAMAS